MKRYKLNEIYSGWLTSGIFSDLNAFNVPWRDSGITPQSLDIAYHGGHSGNKWISPLLNNFVSEGQISNESRQLIALSLFSLYGASWEKEYATLSAQYNPIENYNMVEEMTDDITTRERGTRSTRTPNLSRAKSGTETETLNLQDQRTLNTQHTKTGTETETFNLQDQRTLNTQHAKTGTEQLAANDQEVTTPALQTVTGDAVYGFNSGTAVNTDTRTENATGTNTVVTTKSDTTTFNLTEVDTGTDTTAKTGTDATQYNVTEADTGTDTTAKTGTDTMQYGTTETETGTDTTAYTGTDTDTRNYKLTRSGNIGVTTSQQMLQAERDLWLWNYFNDVIFPDIDKALTLCVY